MRINHAIRTLIISDFYLNAGLSLFGPIFAIFVTQQIPGANIAVIGFGAAITQIVKISLEIPIAKYLDKNHGEYDDFYSLVLGNILIISTPFLYILATKVAHIYMIQAIAGAALAFIVPPWNAIFSRHLDKSQESVEWAFESIAIGIATGGAAAIGGIIAQKFGFKFVFLIGGLVAIIGAVEQLNLFVDLRSKVKQGVVKPQPDRAN
jgi:MFS family permease